MSKTEIEIEKSSQVEAMKSFKDFNQMIKNKAASFNLSKFSLQNL